MVVRASELPPPRRVSDEDFDAICASFKVDRGERQALRRRLDNIVDALAKSLREGRLRPDRKADRDWLHGALKAIQKARAALPSRPGPAAEVPLNVAGAQLAYVVTVIWLLEIFDAAEQQW